MQFHSKYKILILFILVLGQFKIHSAEPSKLKVIAENGAVLRAEPSIQSKKITVLKYGTLLELLSSETTKEVIKLELPLEGNWLKVRFKEHVGYIFSPLTEDANLNKYQCPVPDVQIQEVAIADIGRPGEFCKDGTYIMNNSYNCAGRCWEHGCWRISQNGHVELSKKKISETTGIGKRDRCTHFCTYKTYKIVNKTLSQEGWQHDPDSDAFAEYYKTGGVLSPSNQRLRQRETRFSCRDSRQ